MIASFHYKTALQKSLIQPLKPSKNLQKALKNSKTKKNSEKHLTCKNPQENFKKSLKKALKSYGEKVLFFHLRNPNFEKMKDEKKKKKFLLRVLGIWRYFGAFSNFLSSKFKQPFPK
jgi:hypothetical protein